MATGAAPVRGTPGGDDRLHHVALAALQRHEATDGWLAFHPGLAQELVGHGISSVADLCDWAGETVSEHSRTVVVRVMLEQPGRQAQELYCKHRRVADRKDDLRSLLRRGRVVSGAELEWELLIAISELGIPTPVPVAIGARTTRWRQEVSVLVTAALAGSQPLDEVVAVDPGRAHDSSLRQLTADCVATLHRAGWCHPDLYARHLYLDDDRGELALIDLERCRRDSSWRQRARDLAALDVSLSPAVVGQRQRLAFLLRYLRQLGVGDRAARLSRARQLGPRIVARRRLLVSRGRGPWWEQVS